MILAYAGPYKILPTRLWMRLGRHKTRVIWPSPVSGRMLYIHVPDLPEWDDFSLKQCNWSKVDDQGWYQGDSKDGDGC